jgi:hypothetical protein
MSVENNYQFALSFEIVGSKTDPPPEILFPVNVTPLAPSIGSLVNIPDGNGNLIQGTVQSITYNIGVAETTAVLTISPIIGDTVK